MRAHPDRILEFLDHILDSIAKIERYIEGFDKEAFFADELVQDAVVRNLEIVGEASHRILIADPDFQEAHPEIELTRAYRTRNAIIHGYDEVDFSIVWNVATINFPALKRSILQFRRNA